MQRTNALTAECKHLGSELDRREKVAVLVPSRKAAGGVGTALGLDSENLRVIPGSAFPSGVHPASG